MCPTKGETAFETVSAGFNAVMFCLLPGQISGQKKRRRDWLDFPIICSDYRINVLLECPAAIYFSALKCIPCMTRPHTRLTLQGGCVAYPFFWHCHVNFWPKFLWGDNGRMSFLGRMHLWFATVLSVGLGEGIYVDLEVFLEVCTHNVPKRVT